MVVSICCWVLGDGVSAADTYPPDTSRVVIRKAATRDKIRVFVRICTIIRESLPYLKVFDRLFFDGSVSYQSTLKLLPGAESRVRRPGDSRLGYSSFFEVRKLGRKPDRQSTRAGDNEITQPVVSVFDRSNNL
jgi:hypothetical protein